MIRVVGGVGAPISRLVDALAARGRAIERVASEADRSARSREAVVMLGSTFDFTRVPEPDREGTLGGWGSRVLVVTLIGTHPDARSPELRRMWELEEWARGSGLPVLTLRLGPLLGPSSPLWLKLGSRPKLGRVAARPLNPVAEADVLETIERALDGAAEWNDWFELVGPEALTLSEIMELGPRPGRVEREPGAWEPSLAIMSEQRLSECGPWRDRFGIVPQPISQLAPRWAA